MSKNNKTNHKKASIIALVLVAFVAAMSFTLVTNAAQNKNSKTITKNTSGPTFGLYVNPSNTTVKVGNTFSVDVNANIANASVQAISVLVRYNPALLKLTAIDQNKVNPAYSIKTACAPTNGCKKAGDVILIVGYVGTGVIQPKNGLLIGSLKFTTLKKGSTTVAIENNTKLSGFTSNTAPQSLLDSRVIQNSYVNIVKSVVK